MATHYTHELIFDLPDKLVDITQHIFSLSEDGPSEFNMVIHQHTIDDEETLETYAAKLTMEMKKTLFNYQMLTQENVKVAGQAALWSVYTWVQEGQRLHQAQVNFFYRNEQGVRKLIQITATALNKFSDEWKRTFEAFLTSVKLRGGDK